MVEFQAVTPVVKPLPPSSLKRGRRAGYNYQNSPELQRYLEFIEKEFHTVVEANLINTKALDESEKIRITTIIEHRIVEEFQQTTKEMASKLVEAWKDRRGSESLDAFRNSSTLNVPPEATGNGHKRNFSQLSNLSFASNSRNVSGVNSQRKKEVSFNNTKRSTIYDPSKRTYREEVKEKENMKPSFHREVSSRRESVSSKMSVNFGSHHPIPRSTKEEKSDKNEASRGSISKMRYTSRLKNPLI